VSKLSILHISDLHLINRENIFNAIYPSYYRGHLVPAALALSDFVRTQGDQFNAIIVTGDIAESGLKDHLDFARNYLFPIKRVGVKGLGNSPLSGFHDNDHNIYLMPGNHDRFFEPAGIPGNTEFDSVFSTEWSDQIGGVQAATFPVPGSPHMVSIVFGDLCLRAFGDADGFPPGCHWGQGTADYQDTLTKLEIVTDIVRQKAHRDGAHCAVLWALHFPPTTDVTIPAQMQLLQFKRIISLANKLSIRLILSGHIHSSRSFHHGTNDPISANLKFLALPPRI
jgi:hypothetical protein